MDFTSINSMGSYIKNLRMEQKWQMKKRNGDYSADGTKSVSEWIEAQKKKIENRSDDDERAKKNDQALRNIHNKMSAGQRLTASEKQYLKEKDPQTYKKLRDIEAEQEKFERDLKRCRTKEEVQKLKMSHVAQSLTTVDAVKNNPHIPKEKKLEIIMGEQQKMKAIEQSADEFTKSGRYAALPTEAEKLEAEKILKEAEKEKLDPEKDDTGKPEAPETETREDTAAKAEIQSADNAKPAPDEIKKAETISDKTSSETEKAEKTVRAYEKARVTAIKKKRSSGTGRSAAAKATASPAVRKVKRAKNAYPVAAGKAPEAAASAPVKGFEAKI